MNTRTWTLLCLASLLAGCAHSPPQTEEASVRPGVNKRFLSGEFTADKAKEVFEVESREIFASRFRILAAMDLQPGMTAADIGAGTGLFSVPMAQKVGPEGEVLAVELSPAFIQGLHDLIERKKLTNVRAIACTDRDANLPANRVDLAFICDTYHHFEFPQSTMTSIAAGLKPGGALVVVDFERIPGKSRQWVLDHVRCGKEKTIEEIERAGFEFVEEKSIRGLRENYFLRFRKK